MTESQDIFRDDSLTLDISNLTLDGSSSGLNSTFSSSTDFNVGFSFEQNRSWSGTASAGAVGSAASSLANSVSSVNSLHEQQQSQSQGSPLSKRTALSRHSKPAAIFIPSVQQNTNAHYHDLALAAAGGDVEAARYVAAMNPPKLPSLQPTEELYERRTGRAKAFNLAKGFGFIVDDHGLDELNGHDVFVHYTAIVQVRNPEGFKSLMRGERVEYSIHIRHHNGKQGYLASNVTGPNGQPVIGDPAGQFGRFSKSPYLNPAGYWSTGHPEQLWPQALDNGGWSSAQSYYLPDELQNMEVAQPEYYRSNNLPPETPGVESFFLVPGNAEGTNIHAHNPQTAIDRIYGLHQAAQHALPANNWSRSTSGWPNQTLSVHYGTSAVTDTPWPAQHAAHEKPARKKSIQHDNWSQMLTVPNDVAGSSGSGGRLSPLAASFEYKGTMHKAKGKQNGLLRPPPGLPLPPHLQGLQA